jgi:hypothetical protein
MEGGFTRQWRRDGVNIAGATGTTYVLQAADVGHVITCRVTATNSVDTASAVSNATASVASAGTALNTELNPDPGVNTGASWSKANLDGGLNPLVGGNISWRNSPPERQVAYIPLGQTITAGTYTIQFDQSVAGQVPASSVHCFLATSGANAAADTEAVTFASFNTTGTHSDSKVLAGTATHLAVFNENGGGGTVDNISLKRTA